MTGPHDHQRRPAGGSLAWQTLQRAFLVSALAVLSLSPAAAQTPAEFYRDKTVTIVVGYSTGGGYDAYARLLSRHLKRHIPGQPNIIVQNMPGAGSLKSLQYIHATAPTDGTVIATFTAGLITQSILEPANTGIDLREVEFLGSLNSDVTVCYTWHTLGLKGWKDFSKSAKALKFSASAKSSRSYQAQSVLKNMFKVNLDSILGYPGSNEENLAIESGELHGQCGTWVSTPRHWLKDNKVDLSVRFARNLPEDMPKDVPFIRDLATSEKDKQVIDFIFSVADLGRPYAVSKKVPADRLAALRRALDDTVKDPKFLQEAKELSLPIAYIGADEAKAIVKDNFATPPDVIKQAEQMLR
jgi:tripartite-type tricarboxylate transporter receptor subunit TctC